MHFCFPPYLQYLTLQALPTSRSRMTTLALALSLALQMGGMSLLAPAQDRAPASNFKMSVATPIASTESAPDSVPDPVGRCLLPRDRNKHSLNQLYEFDHSVLGNRLPVIVIPGRAEEFQRNSWWKGFHHATSKKPDFRVRFKVYVFLYNSTEELDVQAQSLVKDLKKHFSKLPPSQPLMLVTYSLGGVIARDALKDFDLLRQVDTMIAIAVPFHGSPMFDPDWFSEYLNPPNRSPLRRFWDRSLYRGYMFSKSNLTHDLKWDNFDSSKPQFRLDGATTEKIKIIGDQALSKVQPYQEYTNAEAIRAKTIVYASYMANGYTNTNQPFKRLRLPEFVLDNSLAFPKEMVASILPFYGFSVHSVFTYMNHQMANIPTYSSEDPQGQNTHLYRFNDGAIPMSSMLFLPPRARPYDEDINSLAEKATVRKTRIFVNVDHTHLGEYSFLKEILVKPDILHPADGARSPYQWLELDLLRRQAERTQYQQP